MLTQIQSQDPPNNLSHQEDCIGENLNKQLRREEIMWRQKSRIQWLTTTELNMKYFSYVFHNKEKEE